MLHVKDPTLRERMMRMMRMMMKKKMRENSDENTKWSNWAAFRGIRFKNPERRRHTDECSSVSDQFGLNSLFDDIKTTAPEIDRCEGSDSECARWRRSDLRSQMWLLSHVGEMWRVRFSLVVERLDRWDLDPVAPPHDNNKEQLVSRVS